MSYKPYKIGKALGYALLLWIIGFVWGTIVFMVPSLKNLPSVPYISKYPAITIPLLIFYLITLPFFTKNYLRKTDEKTIEGLKFGITIFLVEIVLDILVYVVLFKASDYFTYLSIWFAYGMFVVIPLFTGRWLQRKATR